MELNDQQSKRIESLENEVQSLNKRIEDLQKNSDKKALDSNSTMNMTVLPDATTKK